MAARFVKLHGMRVLCDRRRLLSAMEQLAMESQWRFGTFQLDLHVRAEGSTLVLDLSGGREPIGATIPAAVVHQGSASTPAREFLELIRGLDASEVGLRSSRGAGRRLQIRANGRTYVLPAIAEPAEAEVNATGTAALTRAMPPVLPPLQPELEVEPERAAEAEPDPPPELDQERDPQREPDPETDLRPSRAPARIEGALRRFRRVLRFPRNRFVVAAAVLGALGLMGIGLLPLPHAVRALSLVAAAALAALVPALDVRRRSGDWLEPGVLIGFAYLVLFPMRALVVLLDLDPYENPRVDAADFADVRRVLAVSAVGILIGSVAYVAPAGAWLGARVRLPKARLAEAPGRALPLGIFAVGSIAQFTILAGERIDRIDTILAGRSSGLVSGASVLMLAGLALLARRAAGTREPEAIRALVAAVGVGLLASLLGQFKEVAILSLATPLVVWAMTSGIRIQKRRLVLVGALLLAMFVAVAVWRLASVRVGSANPAEVGAAFPSQIAHRNWLTGAPRPFRPWTPITETAAVVSHRLYGYDSLALAVIYTPAVIPHQNGATLANLASGLVPRFLWPDKPAVGIGYWFAQSYWGTPAGVLEVPQAPTHLGELWIDFGWPGVVIGMTVLGVWYRLLYSALRPRESGTGALVYVIALLTVLPVDRDFPLVYVTLVQRLVFVALLFAVAAVLVRVAERRRAP